MISSSFRDRVLAEVRKHCHSKGYQEAPGVNNFVPHDCVNGSAMALLLSRSGLFDHYLAIAPEGHIYGYFFERLGAKVLSIFTDYPPTKCQAEDDLARIRNGRVLLIEDDVIGGRTLRLVVGHLLQFHPRSLALYLGHTQGIQHLRNVPPEIGTTYLAEQCLDYGQRQADEAAFLEFFQ